MKLKKNKVKEYRKKLGLTQEDLADVVNVTRQTILFVEKGKYVPSLELALKLAKLFRCSVEDLFAFSL
jgi:putative transcriptional regulator